MTLPEPTPTLPEPVEGPTPTLPGPTPTLPEPVEGRTATLSEPTPTLPEPVEGRRSVTRAVLAGGSGFIGTRLAADLTARGYTVVGIGRSGPDARWGERDRIAALVDGADLVVNLAGKSVGCRYTDRNRDEIYRSRIDTTQQLHDAVAAAAVAERQHCHRLPACRRPPADRGRRRARLRVLGRRGPQLGAGLPGR